MNTYSKKMLAKFISCAFIFHSAPIALATSEEVKENTEINKSIDLEQSDPQVTTAETSNDKKGDENAVESNQQTVLVSKQETVSVVSSTLKTVMNKIPDRINEILETKLLSISANLDYPIFLYGDFPSKFIELFFEKQKDIQGNSFGYLSLDINNDETNVDKLKGILDHNPPKIISLSNISCKDFEKFQKIFNLLKNTNKVLLVYIEKERSCYSIDCKEADQFDSLINFNAINGTIDKLCFDDQLFDYYKVVMTNLIQELKKLNSEGKSILSVDISDDDVDIFAEYLSSFPFLKVDKLCINALISAIQRDCQLQLIDFVSSTFTFLGNNIPHSNSVPKDGEDLSTAIHECAHAVVAQALGIPVKYLGISSNCSGLTALWKTFRQSPSYKQILAQIKIGMAGQIAEELLSERGLSDGADSDYSAVEGLLEKAVIMSDRSLASREDAKKEAMLNLYNQLYFETKELILVNGKLIKDLANLLLNRKFINGTKFMSRTEFLKNTEKIQKDVDKINELKSRMNEVISKLSDLSNDPVEFEKFVNYVEKYFKGDANKENSSSSESVPASNSKVSENSK